MAVGLVDGEDAHGKKSHSDNVSFWGLFGVYTCTCSALVWRG